MVTGSRGSNHGERVVCVRMARAAAVLKFAYRVQNRRRIHLFVRVRFESACMTARAFWFVGGELPGDHFVICLMTRRTRHAR
jgi:hypothetical protein